MNNLLAAMFQIFVQDACLLLIYNQISGIRITKRLVIAILLGTIIGSSVMGVAFYLVIISIFYYFGVKSVSIRNDKSLAFFYSIYAVSFFSFAGNLITESVGRVAPVDSVVIIITIPLTVLMNWGLLKIVKPDTKFLETNYARTTRLFLLAVDVGLFILCTLQYTSYSLENRIGSIGNIRYYLTISFLLLCFISLFYLNASIRRIQAVQIQEMQGEQIKNLSQYAGQIESLYNEVRSVRHDFVNIMASLQQSINKNDMAGVRNIYNLVFKELETSIDWKNYQLGNIRKIHIESIKSVVAAKIIEANQSNISVDIELQDDINEIYVHDLDYIRIFSILFDNALEAAKETENPKIQLAIIVDQETQQQFLIIRNSTITTNVNKNDIYERGYSTKGANRGQGLAIMRTLLMKNTNVNLETEVKDYYFTQKISFEKWSLR